MFGQSENGVGPGPVPVHSPPGPGPRKIGASPPPTGPDTRTYGVGPVRTQVREGQDRTLDSLPNQPPVRDSSSHAPCNTQPRTSSLTLPPTDIFKYHFWSICESLSDKILLFSSTLINQREIKCLHVPALHGKTWHCLSPAPIPCQ